MLSTQKQKVTLENRKMKLRKNKTLSASLVFLMMSLCAFAVLPAVNSHTPAWNVPTYAYVSASPNPVGVGQALAVDMWLWPFSPTANGIYGDNWKYTLTVTDPSGNTQNLGTFTSNPTAWAYTSYTPTSVGTYTFQMNFAGMILAGANPPPVPSMYSTSASIGDYYAPSNTTTTVVVQQQVVTPLPQTPLPSGYWQRPINVQNQQWYQIAGNWLYGSYNQTSNFNPYTTAPNSAHIVWTRPIQVGGLIGGQYGSSPLSNYYTDKLYESAFNPPIIINGVLYYNTATAPRYGFFAVNLHTGQQLWFQNSTGPVQIGSETSAHIGTTDIPWCYPQIKYGQILNYYSPNQEGGIPYLWETYTLNSAQTYTDTMLNGTSTSFTAPVNSNVWEMLDAFTGNWICSIANVPTGTVTYGPDGSMLVYTLNANGWFSLWNSTKALDYPNNNLGHLSTGEAFYWMWRPPLSRTVNAINGYMWNVTQPAPVPGEVINCLSDQVIVATTGSNSVAMNWQMEIGLNAQTGQQMWIQNRTLPSGITNYCLMGEISQGVYPEFHENSMQWYGYSIYTGQQVWGPSQPYPNAWGSEPSSPPKYETDAYGNIYAMSVDGIHCLNITNGQLLWNFAGDSSGVETSTPTYPFMQSAQVIADGKVFAASSIQYGDPVYRGAKLYAIDAMSGQKIWSVDGFFTSGMAVADGYLVGFNGYDNSIYCFGKGQSATTVSVPDTAIPKGTPVLVKGTITDQSPGTTCLGIPAKGTPAISDASMSDWMAYLYEQQPEPNNATGVSVTLSVFDPNNNTYTVSTTTSDLGGNFGIEWTPPVPGLYKLTATFAGSNSYYSSQAETMFVVSPASSAVPLVTATATPAPTASQTTAPTTSTGTTVAPTPSPVVIPPANAAPTATYIAIGAVVIVIIAAAAALILRRRK